jgi:hypothetical protein
MAANHDGIGCSQKKTRPVVSDANKTKAITFATRPLRRAPPIGGRRDGPEAVSEKGGKIFTKTTAAT